MVSTRFHYAERLLGQSSYNPPPRKARESYLLPVFQPLFLNVKFLLRQQLIRLEKKMIIVY